MTECERCGNELTGRRQRRFCSLDCYNARGSKRPPTACEACGAPVARNHSRFCSMDCNRNSPRGPYSPTLGRVEDVEILLNFGESTYSIHTRLGISAEGLRRYLERHNRHDLARHFSRPCERRAA